MDLFSSVDPVAAISLGALFVAIVVSCTIRLHVGFLAISLAWIVGVYVAGMTAREVMAGFPTRLFLTLAGVTLLFSQAQANGTLERVAHRAVQYCRGNVGLIPMMFFLISFGLASIGPGNIAATALVAPMAMAVSWQVGVPPFLMSIMVGICCKTKVELIFYRDQRLHCIRRGRVHSNLAIPVYCHKTKSGIDGFI